MRRYLLPALMISLLLSGCGGTAGLQQKLERQRENFAAAQELSFTANVTANLGEEVFQCTLACADTAEGASVEVLAPESVAGVRALVTDGGVTVEYENISLGVGTAGTEDVTPISALPLLAAALRGGFLQRCWRETAGEQELIAAQLYISDSAALTIWYDAGTLAPVHGEFSKNGTTVINCEITEFSYR